MKKVCLIIVPIFLAISSYSQYVYKIKADSVLITNDSCNAELNIENSTRNVCGFLFNKGNGRTEFRSALIKLNDSTYVSGCDTLKLHNNSGNGGAVAFNGLSNAVTGTDSIGLGGHLTKDTTKILGIISGSSTALIIDSLQYFNVHAIPSGGLFQSYFGITIGGNAMKTWQGGTVGTPDSAAEIYEAGTILGINSFNTVTGAFTGMLFRPDSVMLNGFGAGTHFTGTETYNLGVDAYGRIVETTVGGGSQSWEDVMNISPDLLTSHTSFFGSGVGWNIVSNINGSAFTVSNSNGGGVGAAFDGPITGAVLSSSTYAAVVTNYNSSNNTSQTGILYQRSGASGTVAAGFGINLRFGLQDASNFQTPSNYIHSEWIDPTHATYKSRLRFQGFTDGSGTPVDLLYLNGDGSITLPKYGVGTFTGTATHSLNVDASGNIIEGTVGGGGGGTVTSITTASPLTGGIITTAGTIGINDAAADGTTKGAASFAGNDFNASSGNITIDYTNGQKASSSIPGFATSNQTTGTIGLTVDGQGGTVSTGSKGFVTIPYNCIIANWYVSANVSGSIQFDIKRSGTSIVGSGNKPLLSSAQNGNAAASGWTSVSVSAGDILEWVIDSATTISNATVVLKVYK